LPASIADETPSRCIRWSGIAIYLFCGVFNRLEMRAPHPSLDAAIATSYAVNEKSLTPSAMNDAPSRSWQIIFLWFRIIRIRNGFVFIQTIF
jgi:hypothetical protein